MSIMSVGDTSGAGAMLKDAWDKIWTGGASTADSELYAQVVQEVAQGTIDPGLMAKAMAQTAGDVVKAQALYLKMRVTQLKEYARAASARERIYAREEAAAAAIARRTCKLLFVRTNKAPGSATTFAIVVNDSAIGEIANGEKKEFAVEPGDYSVCLRDFPNYSASYAITIAATGTAFFTCESTLFGSPKLNTPRFF